MTFRDVADLRPPRDTDAVWYAQTTEEWEYAILQSESNDSASLSFTALLKKLWQSPTQISFESARQPGSITLMYGILSVAREVLRRGSSTVLLHTKPNSAVGDSVERSLTRWEQAWQKTILETNLPWRLPTCTCLLQLARSTLFEISPIDLQLTAGKDVVEGRRRGRADYANAQRRIKTWARSERGRRGVSRKSYLKSLIPSDIDLA